MRRSILLLGFLMLFIGVTLTDAVGQSCPGGPMTREWIECRQAVLDSCAFVGPRQSAACEADALRKYLLTQYSRQQQSGTVAPISAWQCPASHPLKGNFTTYNGERCIFHVPGGQFYERTKPELCYRRPQDATADGCRQLLR